MRTMTNDDTGTDPRGARGARGERLALLLLVALLVLPAAAAWQLREPLRETDPDAIDLWALTGENGGWDPGELRIAADTSVRLRIVALDVVHGFRIENPNGSVWHPLYDSGPIVPGEPRVVTLPPLPAGVYTFSCSVPCSQLHTSQTGRLVVV